MHHSVFFNEFKSRELVDAFENVVDGEISAVWF
jgi:hypothetical protein